MDNKQDLAVIESAGLGRGGWPPFEWQREYRFVAAPWSRHAVWVVVADGFAANTY